MSVTISALFTSDSLPNFKFVHIFDENSWSNLNYWDDLGRFVSWVVSTGESYLQTLYPDGFDFSFDGVTISSLDVSF